MVGYAWRLEPHWVEVVHRDLPVAGLPPGLAGKRLVQISDLHAGPDVDEVYLLDALATIGHLDPDLLVITGDFITHVGASSIEAVERVIRGLPQARLATVGILGNHDYGRQFSDPDVADQLVDVLSKSGVTILRDAMVEVAGLQMVGLDDLWGPRFVARQVLDRIDRRRAALVLCHNPDAADRDVWSDYRGWILCGHTHGGQCALPFLGPPVLPVRNKRYRAGEIDLHDGRRLYINRGLGHLQRVRFNVRPEITVFTLAEGTV